MHHCRNKKLSLERLEQRQLLTISTPIGVKGVIEFEQPDADFWHFQPLDMSRFDDPVVLAKPASFAASAPTIPRVQVLPNGFLIQLDEWASFDGVHPTEKVHYVVADAGTYYTSDGAQITVGHVDHVTEQWAAIDLAGFDQAPVVVTQSQNSVADTPALERHRATTSTLEVRLQESAFDDGLRPPERIGFIAIEPTTDEVLGIQAGRTPVREGQPTLFDYELDHLNRPVVLAGLKGGGPTSVLRLNRNSLTEGGLQIQPESPCNVGTAGPTGGRDRKAHSGGVCSGTADYIVFGFTHATAPTPINAFLVKESTQLAVTNVAVDSGNDVHPKFDIRTGGNRQDLTIPRSNVDTIEISFSRNVTIPDNSVRLYGTNSGQFVDLAHEGMVDGDASVHRWTTSTALGDDVYGLIASAAISDLDGNSLHGYWRPGAVYPSGPSESGVILGGDFLFHFQILAADGNRDGIVDDSDYDLWHTHRFTSGTNWESADYNGDGATDLSDLHLWNANKTNTVSLMDDPSWPYFDIETKGLGTNLYVQAEDRTALLRGSINDTITLSLAGAGVLVFEISTHHGTLSLADLTGVQIVGGANNSANLVLQGTESAINQALTNLLYTPVAEFTGFDTITVEAGPYSDFFAIRYDYEDDSPYFSQVPRTDYIEDVAAGYDFAQRSGNFIRVADHDGPSQLVAAEDATYTVTLESAAFVPGVFRVTDEDLGATLIGNETSHLEIVGSLGAINAVLETLVVDPEPGPNWPPDNPEHYARVHELDVTMSVEFATETSDFQISAERPNVVQPTLYLPTNPVLTAFADVTTLDYELIDEGILSEVARLDRLQLGGGGLNTIYDLDLPERDNPAVSGGYVLRIAGLETDAIDFDDPSSVVSAELNNLNIPGVTQVVVQTTNTGFMLTFEGGSPLTMSSASFYSTLPPVTVDWGDGSSTTQGHFDPLLPPFVTTKRSDFSVFSDTHIYTEPGIYKITATTGFAPATFHSVLLIERVVEVVDADVDIVLLVDASSSYDESRLDLADAMDTILDNVESQFGTSDFLGLSVASFTEYSIYDSASARPFVLNQPIVTRAVPGFRQAVAAGLRDLPGEGGDGEETLFEALYQVATGAGYDGNFNNNFRDSGDAGPLLTQLSQNADGTLNDSGDVPPYSSFVADPANSILAPVATDGLGGVGFRPGAIPIIIAVTDNGSRYNPTDLPATIFGVPGSSVHRSVFTSVGAGFSPTDPAGNQTGATIQQAIGALVDLEATVVGVGPNATRPRQTLEAIAELTGAINDSATPIARGNLPPIAPGEPLYFAQDNRGFADTIQEAMVGALTAVLRRRVIDQSASLISGPEVSVTTPSHHASDSREFESVLLQGDDDLGSRELISDYAFVSTPHQREPKRAEQRHTLSDILFGSYEGEW